MQAEQVHKTIGEWKYLHDQLTNIAKVMFNRNGEICKKFRIMGDGEGANFYTSFEIDEYQTLWVIIEMVKRCEYLKNKLEKLGIECNYTPLIEQVKEYE